MQAERDIGVDYFERSEYKEIVLDRCIVPRVVLLSEGQLLLVSYQNTRWRGLPGGRADLGEIKSGSELMSSGTHPILRREVLEETGIDIDGYLENKSTCLGIAETGAVHGGRVILRETIIFLCLADKLLPTESGAEWVDLYDIPGPLFPDARMAIERVRRGGTGPILPEFLNPGGKIVYVDFSEDEPKILPWHPKFR